jgi:hypothetical protein
LRRYTYRPADLGEVSARVRSSLELTYAREE